VAFDAEVHEGTALLCRASLEAAFLDFLTLDWDATGSSVVSKEPLTLAGEVRRIEYWELQDAMEKKGMLAGMEEAVKRIRFDGNFGAHIVPFQRKAYSAWFAEIYKIEAKLRDRTVEEKLIEYGEIGPKLAKDFPTWISRDRSLEDLQDTASLFVRIAQAIVRPVSPL